MISAWAIPGRFTTKGPGQGRIPQPGPFYINAPINRRRSHDHTSRVAVGRAQRRLARPSCAAAFRLRAPPRPRAGHRDRVLVGLRADNVVVFGQHPSGRDAGAVLVLKCFDDIEVQVVDLFQELLLSSLMVSFPEISRPPLTITTSSTTNRSTASGSCAFQTSSQNALTISVDRMCCTISCAQRGPQVLQPDSPPKRHSGERHIP